MTDGVHTANFIAIAFQNTSPRVTVYAKFYHPLNAYHRCPDIATKHTLVSRVFHTSRKLFNQTQQWLNKFFIVTPALH